MSKHVGNRNFVAGGKFRQQSCGSQHLCGWVGKQHQDVWIETDSSNIQQSTWRELLRAAREGRSVYWMRHWEVMQVIVIAVELVEPGSMLRRHVWWIKLCRWRRCQARWQTPSRRWACPWGRTPSPRLTYCWRRASMPASEEATVVAAAANPTTRKDCIA